MRIKRSSLSSNLRQNVRRGIEPLGVARSTGVQGLADILNAHAEREAAIVIATLRTSICTLLNCDVPVVLAGMGGVARSELVAAVSAAGGFGFLGMVREPPELIRSEIARVRALTSRNFGVNLIPAATGPDLLEAELEAVISEPYSETKRAGALC
jgi:Nitronate monooxygenase